jgi:flagellar L-ring protein FlgH
MSAATRTLFSLLALALLAGPGCVKHIKPYKPKRREYTLPVPHAAHNAARASGSLFDPTGPGARLTTDARAQTVNDIVVITIDERATAQRDTSTETSREDTQTAALTEFLNIIAEIQEDTPAFDAQQALNFATKSEFKGDGKTSRSDRVEATVPAMVRTVLPNGTLFVEGHRVVLVNSEEHHFYISGVIRPEDIDGAGQVPSSRMADAQIEFTGRGTLTAATEKGWFSSALDYLWPF